MLLIAHRGTTELRRPNRIEGLWDIPKSVDGVEVDVRLTLDRVPVLHHDAALTQDGEPLISMPYRELRGQTLPDGARVPRLVDYLAACRVNRVGRVLLDIKDQGDSAPSAVLNALPNQALVPGGWLEHVVWLLRSVSQAQALKASAPDATIALLRVSPENLESGLAAAREGLVNYLVPCPRDSYLEQHPDLLKQIRRAGVDAGVSIINQPSTLDAANAAGCIFAITDQPH